MIIRDAIWDDIELNRFEENVVRTAELQRLHWIRQLGSTYQVYPCALHTRFDHSLGVSHVAKLIIQSIEQKSPGIIPSDLKEMIPIMGLVHDLAHLPFGHTFETELQLVTDHDKGIRLRDFLKHGQLGDILGQRAEEIACILTAAEPSALDEPYLLEIVKDTISADLLDYIKRDTYFTGIRRSYDSRIIKYFNIAELSGKKHLVIDITEEGAVCQDMLVEMEHLLRVRFTLGERVYNYHTKIAADAMIGKAVHEAGISEEFLYDKGDESLVRYLASGDHGSQVASELGQSFLERRLLTRCYMLDKDSFGGRTHDFVTKYHVSGEVRERCREEEEKLISECARHNINLTHSDLIVFCHEPDMNLKAANVLVRERGSEPERLSKYKPVTRQIQQDHQDLWRFYVFTKKDFLHQVCEICKDYFGHRNLLSLPVT